MSTTGTAKHNTTRQMLRTVVLAALALGLAGCAQDMSDLERYVAEVKARKPGDIEPYPEPKPYKRFTYVAGDRRDPFDTSALKGPEEPVSRTGASDVSPDPNRPPEFLESFPLESLKMVGTIEKGGTIYALIQTPDSTVEYVTVGNHMGQNYGRIDRITETETELTEIVPDGFGGWKKRKQKIALSE